ncbi:MAG TPA: winged helix-turn-helix domain-containing protein [Caldimonas sp.]
MNSTPPPTTTPAPAASLRFGRFELQPDQRRLLVDGEPAALGGRSFDLLLALVERPGQLVGKHALMDVVWPGLVVQENNLAAQVSALRKVLGGDVIATIPGRGYRFVAPLQSSAQAVAPVRPSPSSATSHDGSAATVPALRTNLPVELPALLGRADDLDLLEALVDRHRLVSVVGAGGMGKSLLAQHLLAARRAAYPQGVCWVELTQIADRSELPGAIAAALGVDAGRGEPLAALIAAVAPLTMLLALDNAEHLLADVAHVCQALHAGAPGLRLLVTSQAPLRLAAERVLRIGPLAVPDTALPAEAALRFGAVALFLERARAIDQRFSLDAANTPAAIESCRSLDGLPLAIELAAARAPLLGTERLLASMQDRFKLLTASRNRAAPSRQQTLRSALEWSYGLLDEREQRVFRRLGVVAGSGSLEFIQQTLVDADDALDIWAVVDALDTLVDRSLAAVLTTGDDGESRYRLLETPRAYALERLDEAGERPALQRRHAIALAAMFDAAYEEFFSGRVAVDDWLRRLEADFDNARDALRWARAAGEAEVELRIGSIMLRALPPSLHVERMALADACEARIAPEMPEDLQLRAWIELSCVLADPQKARGRLAAEAALALARRLDGRQADRFDLYHALCRAASAAAQADDLGAARARLDEAQALENPSWPPHRLLWRAEAAQWFARMSGDTADALNRGRRLLALDRERGSHASIAIGNLMDAELAADDPRAAARLGTQLIDSLLGTRHEYSLAFARINLLAALLAQDDAEHARPVAEAAWSRAAVFDLQHAAAAYLALLCVLEGRAAAAVKLAAYSEAIYAARGEAREQNETAATARARSLARRELDDVTFARLDAEGAALRDAEVAAVAFGAGDAG